MNLLEVSYCPNPLVDSVPTSDAPTLTPVGNDIFLIRGLIEPSICNHIIQVAECSDFQAIVPSEERSLRHQILKLDDQNPLLRSTNQLLWSKLAIVQKLLSTEYGIEFPYIEPCSIMRYRRGQFYPRHVDNLAQESRVREAQMGIPTRDISVVGYLNDNFIGGEIYFHRQDTKIKGRTGAVLVFPAYYTHPHESLPVLRGQKYTFTSWLFH